MNQKNRLILTEYREKKTLLFEQEERLGQQLEQALLAAGIKVMAVERRVKEEASLTEKLERKDGKYHALSDITDILGVRIICYFSDDVDRAAACVERLYRVDRENSIDKRALLKPDTFGYLSVHYVCWLPQEKKTPQPLWGYRFEVQIRSTLQHIWAEIEHDLGYKSEFGVPHSIRRAFSRVAGLLEIADEQFLAIRDGVTRYGEDIRAGIAEDAADDVNIDLVSLTEFMQHSPHMGAFLRQMAEICSAEISQVSPESYLAQLAWLGMNTLGDIRQMLREDGENAMALAKSSLEHAELDILSSNAALRYLCRARLLRCGYSPEKMTEFLSLSVTDASRAVGQADALLRQWEMLRRKPETEPSDTV